jgi:hypothetical protein
MGEYGKVGGVEIKMGTCEDMYYLRADQAGIVQGMPGSLDPNDREVQKVIRFRFPWPDEDGTQPGAFSDYGRAVAVHGVTAPEGVEHDTVQFRAQAGYLLSMPCPEGPGYTEGFHAGIKVHRNGFQGAVLIDQQAYRGGALALICRCGGCGTKWNVPTLAEAEPIIVACRAEADRVRQDDGRKAWWHAIADRIEAGYKA